MKTPTIAIAIPARYNSTRFPGKPLALLAGKPMVDHVIALARAAIGNDAAISYFVTTDDKRIEDHVRALKVPVILTSPHCPTGSDRVLAALRQLDEWPDCVINLQGDAPLIPLPVLRAMIAGLRAQPTPEVITPVRCLSWEELDALRTQKLTTPYSGTTAIVNERGRALWFSKSIIPTIRNEPKLKMQSQYSPVHQHIGLYGFRSDILERFCSLPMGVFEECEGLEQLRLLEHEIKIQTFSVDPEWGEIHSGIDSPEDLLRAETFLLAQKNT